MGRAALLSETFANAVQSLMPIYKATLPSRSWRAQGGGSFTRVVGVVVGQAKGEEEGAIGGVAGEEGGTVEGVEEAAAEGVEEDEAVEPMAEEGTGVPKEASEMTESIDNDPHLTKACTSYRNHTVYQIATICICIRQMLQR